MAISCSFPPAVTSAYILQISVQESCTITLLHRMLGPLYALTKEEMLASYSTLLSPPPSLSLSSSSSSKSLSHVRLCDHMDYSTPGFPVCHQPHWSLLKLMSVESVMPSNHLMLCHPLLLLPSIFPSIRVFSHESVLRIWPNYWSFSFNISLSSEYSGLISFRMDCLDLLAVQGTLKSLLQHHSSKASILQHSAFFIVQFSHPYMTTGKP